MADALVSRSGQVNAAGDPKALFLKVFAGEVHTAFGRESAFRPRHQVRVIANGKSASFPAIGYAQAQYHTPGAEILGQSIKANERVIVIDDQIIAPVFIANIDEAMNHYDVRSIYSNEIGEALAKLYDQNVARAGILAARSPGVVDGVPGGTTSNNAAYANDGTVIWQGIFNAGVTLDGKDVPGSDRNAFIRPVQYALVVMSEKPIHRDLNDSNGSLAMGNIERVNNIALVKTNNLPSANDAANEMVTSHLRADYSPTQVLVAHRSAMGTVQLQDVSLESGYDMRRQGTLMVGKYLVGSDKLRGEAAVELRTGDPA